MREKIIVTNLRIPENLWLQVKTNAYSLGLSANEYIKELIHESTRKEFFAYKEKKTTHRSKKVRLYEPLWRLLEKPYKRKPMGASEDDKIIYGIEDN